METTHAKKLTEIEALHIRKHNEQAARYERLLSELRD
jgi:hypothetical protein